MNFKVSNKIEVRRGGYILVPGCEPLSNLTSPTLLANFEVCNNTYVKLEDALEAIPDATIEYTYNPFTRWFVLPSGSPAPEFGCREMTCDDWYAILRAIPSTNISADELDCGKYKDSFDYFGGPKID